MYLALYLRGLSAAALLCVPSVAQNPLREHLGPAAELRFGKQLCSLGDADGDGIDDYAVATLTELPGNADPELAAFSGRDGRRLWRFVHTLAGEFGASLSAAGDQDGDGLGDLWVGVPAQYGGEPGAVQLRRGRDGAFLRQFSTPPDDPTGFGWRVAGVGDVNGDGRRDLAVLSSRIGRVEMRSGANWVVLWTMTSTGPFSEERSTLENVLDCDGDGFDDVAYGNPSYYTGNATGVGQVLVYSGRTGALIRLVNSPRPTIGANFGRSLCGLGDLDGDGRAEVAIGLPLDSHPLTTQQCGSAVVVSPSRGVTLYTFYPPARDSANFGGAVSRLGDLDEDGVQDLGVGAPIESSAAGTLRVFSGRSGRKILELSGTPSEQLGSALAPLGDLNGDGRSEWLLAAEGASVTLPRQGRVVVMSGRFFASAVVLGRGCSYSGAPEPRLYASARPVLGAPFDLVNGANAPAVVLLGVEANVPLRVGFSDCYFQLDLASSAVIGLLGASSSWPIALPNESALVGLAPVFQGVYPDPLSGSYGIAVSNGLLLRLGR
jgi:hypothetical protein